MRASARETSPRNETTPAPRTLAPAQTALAASKPREYTLDSLAPLLGTYDEDLRDALFEIVSEEKHLRRGKRVCTDHILDDVARFLGSTYDIWHALSEQQRKKVNLDPRVFAVCLREAVVLEQLRESHGQVTAMSAGGKAGRKSQARQALRAAKAARWSLLDSLGCALAAPELAHAEKLAGTVKTPTSLVDGSQRLVDYVLELIERATKNDRLRLRTYNITTERVDELRNKVAQVAAATIGIATPARRVEQRKLDIQDGRVLFLMGIILRAFRAARREDPTILLPEVRALARHLVSPPRPGRRKVRPTTPPESATPDGSVNAPSTASPRPPATRRKRAK